MHKYLVKNYLFLKIAMVIYYGSARLDLTIYHQQKKRVSIKEKNIFKHFIGAIKEKKNVMIFSE